MVIKKEKMAIEGQKEGGKFIVVKKEGSPIQSIYPKDMKSYFEKLPAFPCTLLDYSQQPRLTNE